MSLRIAISDDAPEITSDRLAQFTQMLEELGRIGPHGTIDWPRFWNRHRSSLALLQRR
jgi:hypothetical protein